MNILIAEDEPISRLRLQHVLEGQGHRVYPCAGGEEALEKFLGPEIDLVITDWMMPGMDGLNLARQIRYLSRERPYVYIILLTAKNGKGDVINGLTQGKVDDYMIKPLDPEELQARLQVAERITRLERSQREYGQGLERVVRMQTRKIRSAQEETIIRLLTALSSRDEETGNHVKRLGDYSALIAGRLGWPEDRIEDLRLAAMMHDVGKIGVPDGILLKNGRLNEEEFVIIKTHTLIGGEILGGSDVPMLQMAQEIALGHHERWDGRGYPRGAAGEAIPESARIVALVDVFDALSTDRIYRPAMVREEVLRVLQEGRGSQFDPQIVEVFFSLQSEFFRIREM
ncbi:MAG: response regulator [Deltaproteobacteria bacterium]|nr:response regulator [Deltaproteobacteria bacterium]